MDGGLWQGLHIGAKKKDDRHLQTAFTNSFSCMKPVAFLIDN